MNIQNQASERQITDRNTNIYETKGNKVKEFFKKYGLTLLFCFLAVAFVGGLSYLFTDNESVWIQGLTKPVFYPPNIVFSIVWPIIYILLTVATTIYFSSNHYKMGKRNVLILWVINGVLNIIWTLTFFTLKSLTGSVIVFALLLTSAIALIVELFRTSKGSFYFTIPYVVWLMFAFILNYTLFLLNVV